MTPLKLQMMLHYYAIAAPYAEHWPEHANSIAVQVQREELVEAGLLQHKPISPSGYTPTLQGRVLIKAIRAVGSAFEKSVMTY